MFNRAFAYMGVAPLYPAEVFILWSFAVRGGKLLTLWIRCIRNCDPVFIFFLLFLLWGMVETFRGIAVNGELSASLRGFAAHYYALFFFIGIVISEGDTITGFANRFWLMSVIGGVYGILWAVLLSHFEISIPWVRDRAAVSIFSDAGGVLFLAVGAAALSPVMRRSALLPLLILSIALLGPFERAVVLGVAAGIVIVILQQGNSRLLLQIGLAVAGVAIASALAGELVSMGGGVRSGSMTLSWLIARLVSIFAPEQAFSMLSKMGSYQEAYQIYELHGDADWRQHFWEAVIRSLDSQSLWLVGHGYGVSLGSFAGHPAVLRTPHNAVIYFLGYTGVIGLMIFAGLLTAFLVRFIRLPRSPMRTFLLAELVAMTIRALAANSFETPYGAVPFYLLLGMAYGVARQDAIYRRTQSRVGKPQTTGRSNVGLPKQPTAPPSIGDC